MWSLLRCKHFGALQRQVSFPVLGISEFCIPETADKRVCHLVYNIIILCAETHRYKTEIQYCSHWAERMA